MADALLFTVVVVVMVCVVSAVVAFAAETVSLALLADWVWLSITFDWYFLNSTDVLIMSPTFKARVSLVLMFRASTTPSVTVINESDFVEVMMN